MTTARDIKLGNQARTKVAEFLTRESLQALTGGHTVTTVDDLTTDAEHGDLRINFRTGGHRYVEVKHVAHNLGTPNAPEHVQFTNPGNTLPTTIFEVLKGSDRNRPFLDNWKWKFLHTFNLTPAQAATMRVLDQTNKANPVRTTLQALDLRQQHLNTTPYVNGAIAAYIHLPSGHLMLDDGQALLARTRTAMLRYGLYMGAGASEPNTLIARHIPYSHTRFIQSTDSGWWPVGDHIQARENVKTLLIPTVSAAAA